MTDTTLKEKLTNKLKKIDDPALLEEVSNLFELQEPGTVYQVTNKQKKAIGEAKYQIKKEGTISNEKADKEADEWLKD